MLALGSNMSPPAEKMNLLMRYISKLLLELSNFHLFLSQTECDDRSVNPLWTPR